MSQGNRHDTEGFLRQVATGTLFTMLRVSLVQHVGGRFGGPVRVHAGLMVWCIYYNSAISVLLTLNAPR